MAGAAGGPWNPSDEHFSPLGEVLGQYRTIRELGAGAFGVVYEATHPDRADSVALKVSISSAAHFSRCTNAELDTGPERALLIDSIAMPQQVFRGRGHSKNDFEEEVVNLRKALATPPDTRVVRLVDSFIDIPHGGCFCVATTPVCETTLKDVLSSATPPDYSLQTALRWALELADTLLLLHGTDRCRLYHGDLHPGNIFLHRKDPAVGGFEGLEAYVGDLGIAIHNHPFGLREDLKFSWDVSVAPELATRGGLEKHYDARADVWSWGVALYALLAKSWSRLEVAVASDGGAEKAFFTGLFSGDTPEGVWHAELGQPWGGVGQLRPELLELVAFSTADKATRASLHYAKRTLRRLLGLAPLAPGLKVETLMKAELALFSIRSRPSAHVTAIALARQHLAGTLEPGAMSQFESDALVKKSVAHRALLEFAQEEDCLRAMCGVWERAWVDTCEVSPTARARFPEALLYLAERLFEQGGRFEEALALCMRAEEAAQRGAPHKAPTAWVSMAKCHYDAGRLDEAMRLVERAAGELEAMLPEQQRAWADAMELRANIMLDSEGGVEGAVTLLEAVRELRQERYAMMHDLTRRALLKFMEAYWRAGDLEAMMGLFSEMAAEVTEDEDGTRTLVEMTRIMADAFMSVGAWDDVEVLILAPVLGDLSGRPGAWQVEMAGLKESLARAGPRGGRGRWTRLVRSWRRPTSSARRRCRLAM